jgi:cilia- and flagella-associated protein 298
VEPALAGPLHAALNDAEVALAPAAVSSGVAASAAGTLALIGALRAAADAALGPTGGLHPDDPMAVISAADPGDAVLRAQLGSAYLDGATAELWWAGKPFPRGATVGDRVGRNDKTKVVAKLQPPGAGAPPREPAVSEAERAAMMAWYFKKTEEAQALAEEDRDDRYLQQQQGGASWADPRALKTALNGTAAISWRPTA